MSDVVRLKRIAEGFKLMYKKSISCNEIVQGITPPDSLILNYKYPLVRTGLLISENEEVNDSSMYKSIEEVVESRMRYVYATKVLNANVIKTSSKFYEELVESSLSVSSVEVETKIKYVFTKLSFRELVYGVPCKIKYLRVTGNSKAPSYIFKILESDASCKESVTYLYSKTMDEFYISRLFSLGLLGKQINRRLIPSKWAITSVYKILVENFIAKLRDYDSINDVFVFNGELLGNIFYIITFPGNLNCELLECFLPGCAYNPTNSVIFGRDEESGGYYATYFSFLEFLNDIRRKANAIVVRVVTNEYYIPLGVWVVRKGVRKAFLNKVSKFSNLIEALRFVNNKLSKYNLSIYKILKYSKLYGQKKLSNWIKD